MSTSEARAVTDAGRLSWDQICDRFPDEWVVVADIEWLEDGDCVFKTALVLGHDKRRKDASPQVKAAFQYHDEIGCYWTGEIRGPIPRFVIP